MRVLSEFLRCHAERFQEYVELTVVRSLEAHKDPVKEVIGGWMGGLMGGWRDGVEEIAGKCG